MTGPEFKKLREKIGSQDEVATMLRTPLRTLQDWEAKGRDKVPGVAVAAVVLLLERTDLVMADIKTQIEARIAREFPNGIQSEIEPGWLGEEGKNGRHYNS